MRALSYVTLFVATSLLVACGDSEVTPPDGATDSGRVDAGGHDAGDAGDAATADAGDAATVDAGGDATIDDAGDGSVDDAGDGSIADGGVDAACDPGDGGCVTCPVAPSDFLNQCSASTCSPFDNATRLPGLLSDGGLPSLP